MSDAAPPSGSLTPGLYIVATPIGNLGDITLRAADILARCDAIACEDTRVTGKLLKHLGVSKPLWRYDDHSAARDRGRLIEAMRSRAVALVSDAGTPLVSDPGYRLVNDARAEGIAVTALPPAIGREPDEDEEPVAKPKRRTRKPRNDGDGAEIAPAA